MKREKKHYVRPSISIEEFLVERGIAASGDDATETLEIDRDDWTWES